MEINAVIFPFPAVLQLRSRIAFGDGELWAAPRGGWRCLCLLVKIVGENAWLVHIIRHLRRRCAHTIATQQEMEISLRLFPFPTVLSTIYRLRRIPGFQFTDFRSAIPNLRISGPQFPVRNSRAAIPDSRFWISGFRGQKGHKTFKSERFVKNY